MTITIQRNKNFWRCSLAPTWQLFRTATIAAMYAFEHGAKRVTIIFQED